MFKFLFLSLSFWAVVYIVNFGPDHERLESLKERAANLQIEINNIDNNFKYLKAEREDLLNNDRFYIRKLSREKLRLTLPPSVAPTKEPADKR